MPFFYLYTMKKIKRTAAEKKQIALEIIEMFSSDNETTRNKGIIKLSALDRQCYLYFIDELTRKVRVIRKYTPFYLRQSWQMIYFFNDRWHIKIEVSERNVGIFFRTFSHNGEDRRMLHLHHLGDGWFSSAVTEELEYLIETSKTKK